eukprot:scaffold706_cov418-Prasinococcus_capsulatus_cf.AAC.65
MLPLRKAVHDKFNRLHVLACELLHADKAGSLGEWLASNSDSWDQGILGEGDIQGGTHTALGRAQRCHHAHAYSVRKCLRVQHSLTHSD